MCVGSFLILAYVAIGGGWCLYEAHCIKRESSDLLDGDDWFDAAFLGAIWPVSMMIRR